MIKKIEIGQFLIITSILLLFIPYFAHAETSSYTSEKEKIESFFADNKAMIEIAQCESGLRQTTDSGSVLRGGLNNSMIGVFQLHEKYHRGAAESLGLDIDTIDGNLSYAKHLYTKEGLTPWKSCLHAVSDTKTTKQVEKVALSSDEQKDLITQIESLQRKILLLKIQLLTQRYELLKKQTQ